jgi:hypothetical protein
MPAKPKLKTFTYKQIMALKPCYDPVEAGFITEDWKGTAKDVLDLYQVPAKDRVWCALKMLGKQESNKQRIIAFAQDCAKRAKDYAANAAYAAYAYAAYAAAAAAADAAYAAAAAAAAYAAYDDDAAYDDAEREAQIEWLKEKLS